MSLTMFYHRFIILSLLTIIAISCASQQAAIDGTDPIPTCDPSDPKCRETVQRNAERRLEQKGITYAEKFFLTSMIDRCAAKAERLDCQKFLKKTTEKYAYCNTFDLSDVKHFALDTEKNFDDNTLALLKNIEQRDLVPLQLCFLFSQYKDEEVTVCRDLAGPLVHYANHLRNYKVIIASHVAKDDPNDNQSLYRHFQRKVRQLGEDVLVKMGQDESYANSIVDSLIQTLNKEYGLTCIQ